MQVIRNFRLMTTLSQHFASISLPVICKINQYGAKPVCRFGHGRCRQYGRISGLFGNAWTDFRRSFILATARSTYPTLSKLFKKLNSIPASTAHVESFFSDLRYVVEDYRYNLNEETTSLIMLGKHCLK